MAQKQVKNYLKNTKKYAAAIAGSILFCYKRGTAKPLKKEKGKENKMAKKNNGYNPNYDEYNPNAKKAVRGFMGKNAGRKKQEKFIPPTCPVCGAQTKCVPIEEMQFKGRYDDSGDYYWCCSRYPMCNTYVKANPKTKQPYGTLAGPTLRFKRQCLHYWEDALMNEEALYGRKFAGLRSEMAYALGIPEMGFHIRNLTEAQCDTLLAHFKKRYKTDSNFRQRIDQREGERVWMLANDIPWEKPKS